MWYRYLIICTFLISVSFLSKAQGTEKNWLFGSGAAIEFTPTGAVSNSVNASPNSYMSVFEGGTSISDESGNLLFYFSENTIYTKTHTIMVNGMFSVTSAQAAQGCIIMKDPGSANLYYVFYTTDWQSTNGLNYAIVDMNLNSGLGEVIIKDQSINVNIKERLVAVNKPCSNEVWIVGHEKGNNNYVAYLLTYEGISSGVVSSVGSVQNASNIYGCMRLSKDATRLAIASGGSGGATLELVNFDYTTGTFSNAVTLETSSSLPEVYGVEFAPSGNVLYAAEFSYIPYQRPNIYQYNLLAGSTANIIATRITINGTSTDVKGSLLCGPDGKVYVAVAHSTYIGVINKPEILNAAGCDYNNAACNAIGTIRLGLPNFSAQLLSGCLDQCADCIPSYSPEKTKTYVLSAWVKEEDPSKNKTTYNEAQISLAFAGSSTTAGPFKGKGNIIDGWQRIEEVFTVPGDAKDIQIKLSSPGVDGYFDDIRVFPTDGSMKSYVYDPISLKLVAELDENNYATFYEYDEEGALVRVKKETERGVMTIQENRSSTPKQ